ncbi:MAG: AAA family ATPase [Actinomycetales bacterium]
MADPHLVNLLRRRLLGAPARCGRTAILAIDGRSGAGKSTLAGQILARLPPQAALISLEELYPGWHGLAAAADLLRRWVLRPLAAGRPARYYHFDWTAGRFADEPVIIGRPRWLVVEGVGALDPRVAAFVSVGVWLQAPTSLRYLRAMNRDGDLYRPWWDVWAAQERRYLGAGRAKGARFLTARTQASSPTDR